MTYNVTYSLAADGAGFNAVYNGRQIGQITFVRVGADRVIIDHTAVDADFRNADVGLNLVRQVCNWARGTRRRVIALCPFARAMFNKYSEFDDVRLMNVHA